MDPKLIIIFCLALFIFVAILLLRKQKNAPKNEKIKFILKRLEYGNELNQLTIKDLTQYAKLNNCPDAMFMQGITFSKGIHLLHELQETVFSTENRLKLTAVNQSVPQLEEGLKKLETYIQHIIDIRTIFDFNFKNKIRADHSV